MLLLTTALSVPPVFAQSAPDSEPPSQQSTDQASDEVTVDDSALVVTEEPAEEEVDISTTGGGDMAEEIVVTGRYIPDTVRATPEVVSVLSSADIARTGEGDIAGALQRVTGLSVVGNGFVYVRGLGDRYSLALLNGSPLPSPEPLRRVVPLDIFPSSIVSSVLVQKSFSPNYPGEFGGGVINLTSQAIPDQPFLNFGYSISGDSETTGQLGYTYFGSPTDFTGFDNGERDVPDLLADALNSGLPIVEGNDFSAGQIRDITASLSNARTTVLQRNTNLPINFSTEISGGKSWDVGENGRVGIIATAGLNNTWRTRDAIQNITGDPTLQDVPANETRAVVTDNRIVANGLVGLGYEFGEHKLRLTTLYIRDVIKQGRLQLGIDRLSLEDFTPFLTQNTSWFERSLFDTQFVGEFEFDDLDVDMRYTYANSQRESPYERSFRYVFNPEIGDFINNLQNATQGANIAFSDLDEDLYYGGIDLSYRLPTTLPITVSGGYAYNRTFRDSTRREFQFRPTVALGVAAQQRPDFLLSDFNIYTFDIRLQETQTQLGAAAYEAGLEIHAGYAQFEVEFFEGLRLSGGVRYEDADQFVQPLDLFGSGQFIPATLIANDYWLPAATLTWNFAEDMQLRLHGSRTIARPQFRELAPQIYQDPEADRQFFGNPFLVDSQLTNFEGRFEWYFGRGERLSVAGFYKKIDNPIEQYQALAGGGTLQTTFVNAPSAELYGAELELQKYFALDTFTNDEFFETRRAVIIANYTYSTSDVRVSDNEFVLLPLSPGQVDIRPSSEVLAAGRSLTGQSDHIANLQIGMEDTETLSQQTILFNYASERLTNRGQFTGLVPLPDIIERPGLRIDFVARQAVQLFAREIEIKFEARNITGENFEEFQAVNGFRNDINTYDLGTSFSLGATVKF